MDIRPVKTDADHKEALKEVDQLWKSPEGSPEGDKLDVIITLVEAYEGERWPMEVEGDPVEVIIAHMDVTGRSQADLAQLLGSRSRASEVLNRKRALTLEMIHKLNQEWKIPADLLVPPYKLVAA